MSDARPTSLAARSHWAAPDGAVALSTLLVFGKRSRAHLVVRRGLSVDSRWLAAGPDETAHATLHVHLEGLLATSDGRRITRPAAHVLASNEFERVDGRGGHFVSTGALVRVFDISVPRDDILGPIGIERGERALSPATWAAAHAFAAADVDGAPACYAALLAGFVDDGLLHARALAGVDDPEPDPLLRVWSPLAALYAKQDTGAALKAILALLRVSPRQVARDLEEMRLRSCMHGGFRVTARTVRLRRAVVLLSARTLSVAFVAREVGYGSAIAMARAFRDAGLPPPSTVRARWLDGESARSAS